LQPYYGKGKVSEVFGERDKRRWSKLRGSACLMHVLYSTVGKKKSEKQPKTKQPILFSFHGKRGAISHNGNLVRLNGLRARARRAGYKFRSKTSDTEVIAAMLSTSEKKDFLGALVEVLKEIEDKGAFSLGILFGEKIIGVRCGIRPLCIGKRIGRNGEGDSYMLASEDCVFPALSATRNLREVEPGELVVLGSNGIEESIKWGTREYPGFCVGEFIYFARPASTFMGVNVSEFRFECGRIMARNHPVEADRTVPVPNSGRHYSDGFSFESHIPIREAIEKVHYDTSSRTFMEERGVDRGASQRKKLQAITAAMRGKQICLTEDSVYRASVGPKIVKMCREHGGALRVHMRIGSPPVRHICHLGFDTATHRELPASHMTVAQIRHKVIHSDSLEYLSVEELKQVLRELGLSPDDFCLGCFTGKYPVEPPAEK
jgi:amidophosphoribosyltransferase